MKQIYAITPPFTPVLASGAAEKPAAGDGAHSPSGMPEAYPAAPGSRSGGKRS